MGDGKSGLSHMPSSSSSFPACPDDQATQVLEKQEEEERGKGELRPEGGKRGHGESLEWSKRQSLPSSTLPPKNTCPLFPPSSLLRCCAPEKLKSPIPPFSGLDHRLVVSSFLLSLFPPLPTDGSRKERKNQEMNANSFERGWVKTSSVFI